MRRERAIEQDWADERTREATSGLRPPLMFYLADRAVPNGTPGPTVIDRLPAEAKKTGQLVCYITRTTHGDDDFELRRADLADAPLGGRAAIEYEINPWGLN